MNNPLRLLRVLIFVLIFGCSPEITKTTPVQETTNLKTTDGIDLSLPENIQPLPNIAGFLFSNEDNINTWQKLYPIKDNNQNNIYFAEFVMFNWATVNPSDGVYDWSVIDAQIEKIEKKPYVGFQLFPKIYTKTAKKESGAREGGEKFDFRMVPEWVKVNYLAKSGLAAGWDPKSNYLEKLNLLIQKLGERYANHPRYAMIVLPQMDFMFGEGQFRTPGSITAQEHLQDAVNNGMTPDTYYDFLTGLFDIFKSAFPARTITWTNFESTAGGMPEEYAEKKLHSWQYIINNGGGGRDGQVENWMRYISEGFGNTLDPEGYLINNEEFPPYNDDRVWWTENENHTPGRFYSTDEEHDYFDFVTNIRALQMRRNWQWVPSCLVEKKHPYFRYAQLSQGRTRENSPDAWCWLREGMIHKEQTVKNFERWLFQRDVATDGKTVPAEKFDITKMNIGSSARKFEYIARKTNHLENQNSIYFKVDKQWFEGNNGSPVKLYISYINSNESQWLVEYDGANGKKSTPVISQDKSGKVKTVILELPDFQPKGSFDGQMDFRIRRQNGEDAVIQFVRMVK